MLGASDDHGKLRAEGIKFRSWVHYLPIDLVVVGLENIVFYPVFNTIALKCLYQELGSKITKNGHLYDRKPRADLLRAFL